MKHEHKKMKFSTNFHVYRGQKFSTNELSQLQNAVGQYISFNSFLSTSKNAQVAELFAGDDSATSALLDIDINKKNAKTTKPFATIADLSYVGGDEEEVLFMLGTIFRLVQVIEPKKSNEIWVLKLELANEDEHCLREFFQYRKDELGTETSLTDLEPLLAEMKGANIKKSADLVEQEQGKSTLWSKVLRGSINFIETSFGNDTGILIKPLISLGLDYCNNGSYQLAIESFEKCLLIQNNNRCVDNDPRICDTLLNLGLVYKKMGDYDRAMDYLNESAFRREQNLTSQDQQLALADSYIIIADLYFTIKQYKSALTFQQIKALPIYLNIQSKTKTQWLKLAELCRSIGIIYEEINNNNVALDNYKQSFEIYADIYPFNGNNDVFHHHNQEMKDITQRLTRMIGITKRADASSLLDNYYGEFNDNRDEAQRLFTINTINSTP